MTTTNRFLACLLSALLLSASACNKSSESAAPQTTGDAKPATEAVKRTLRSELERNPKLFPPLVVQMTAVGERAGTVDEMLEEIAEFYESQVSQVMNNMSSIIEPFLILFLGAAVGGIALAIITPIYALTQKFGQ